MKRIIHFACTALFLLPLLASAQLSTQDLSGSFYIELSPLDPVPGELTTATVRGYVTPPSGYSIVWQDGAKRIGEGASVTFTAPETGKDARLKAILTNDAGQIEVETVVAPIALSLVIEGSTLVPPLYKGAKLPTPGSPVIAQALADVTDSNGKTIPESKLMYTWSVDDKVVSQGYGRSTLAVKNLQFKNTAKIDVSVEGPDGQRASKGSTVTLSTPQTILYENSPLFGPVYNSAIPATNILNRSELTILAFPYFAPTVSLYDPRLTFSWTVNDAPVNTRPNTPEILLGAKSGSGSAKTQLGVHMSDNYLFETGGAWDFTFNALTGN